MKSTATGMFSSGKFSYGKSIQSIYCQSKSLSVFVCFLFFLGFTGVLSADSGAGRDVFDAVSRGNIDDVRSAISSGFDVNTVYKGDTLLSYAIRRHSSSRPRTEIITMILQSRKLSVNKAGNYYYNGNWIQETPLIVAATKGMHDIVTLLLKKGADINYRRRVNSRIGYSALMCAAGYGHLETVRVLLDHRQKPDLSFQDTNGRTAFEFAIKQENFDMVKLIYSKGVRINRLIDKGNSILTLTFPHERFDILDFLIARGADINLVGKNGETVLCFACNNSQSKKYQRKFASDPLRFLKKILSYRPKINRCSGIYGTALHCAVRSGNGNAVQILLAAGADINCTDVQGQTPLHTAVKAGKSGFAGYLIRQGAGTEAVDRAGFTPVFYAIYNRDRAMLQVLLKGKAALNVRSAVDPRLTPLSLAADSINPLDHGSWMAVMEQLLRHGAKPDFQSKNGWTPMMVIASRQHPSNRNAVEKVQLLFRYNADPDITNPGGETALMLAAGRSNFELVRYLINRGADIRKKNLAGETVMSYAERSGNSNIVAFLRSKGAVPDAGAAGTQNSQIVRALYGVWEGKQDGLPHAVFWLVLFRNNHFDFKSRFAQYFLNNYPKGSINPVIAEQKGTYRIHGNILTLLISGHPPLSRRWKLLNGVLILDDIIRLRKIR